MPTADELKQRYEQAKLRHQKQTGLLLMLAGLVGTLTTGAALLFFLINKRTLVLQLMWFVLISLVATILGFSAWRRGGNSLKDIDDCVRGPLGD